MKKEEILKVVRSNEGTVLSFPDRGPWGNNRYRGNCSGYKLVAKNPHACVWDESHFF